MGGQPPKCAILPPHKPRGLPGPHQLALHLAQEDSMAKKLAAKKVSRVVPLKKQR